MIDGLTLSYIAELKRDIGGLREEVVALRAKIERMEADIAALYDKWTLPPEMRRSLENK